jgi:hypothetical protein
MIFKCPQWWACIDQELKMFQLFGFGGPACPRCAHKSDDQTPYCAHCGMMLGSPQNDLVLQQNRWVPGANELAVFFGVRELSGIFVKTLRVPASTRAFILQGGKVSEVPAGEYEIEGFFTRLGNLLRDQHAEILITHANPIAVEFNVDDLSSAEQLALGARLAVSLRVGQVDDFARHFMTMPGTVTAVQLRELLAPSVRQLAAEFLAAHSLRDMAANPKLRAQLNERLHSGLTLRMAQFGLAVVRVDTLTLRHDKYDASRSRVGTLLLAVEEGQAALEPTRQLDALYNEEQWQRIAREEQASRHQLRREQLRQDGVIEGAELALASAERSQAIRLREIDLYSRVVDSRSRMQAIERGAGSVLAELEHALAKKDAAREDEAAEWAQLRALAQIKLGTELEAEQQRALEARQLAQQRFSHQLLQQQIANKITQALGIEDEARKRAELQRLQQSAQAAAGNAEELAQERHRADWQELALANAAQRRSAERVQEWEDQLALDRQRGLLRTSGAADALSQHEKLLRTIEADAACSRQQQQLGLDAEQQRSNIRRGEQEAQWQQELRRLEHAREENLVQLAHAAELVRIDLSRIERIGAMSDTAKLALAPAPNAAQLADYMKTGLHAAMSPEQLAALAGVVAASNSVTPAEAARIAAQAAAGEQARRTAEVDQDRRHQLALLALQNDVNKAALASQAQLGLGVAQAGSQQSLQKVCANGHAGACQDRFCARCGTEFAQA